MTRVAGSLTASRRMAIWAFYEFDSDRRDAARADGDPGSLILSICFETFFTEGVLGSLALGAFGSPSILNLAMR